MGGGEIMCASWDQRGGSMQALTVGERRKRTTRKIQNDSRERKKK